MIDFPDLCRRLREKKNWGPLDLAERLGLTRTEVVLIESGERPMPEVYAARVVRLAERWHVSLTPSIVREPSAPDDDLHAVPPPVARVHRRKPSVRRDVPTADEIRALRAARGWSQEDLARAVGVTAWCVSFWELSKSKPRAGSAGKLRLLMGQAAAA